MTPLASPPLPPLLHTEVLQVQAAALRDFQWLCCHSVKTWNLASTCKAPPTCLTSPPQPSLAPLGSGPTVSKFGSEVSPKAAPVLTGQSQLEALLGDGGSLRRRGLTGRGGTPGLCLGRVCVVPGPFLSLSASRPPGGEWLSLPHAIHRDVLPHHGPEWSQVTRG